MCHFTEQMIVWLIVSQQIQLKNVYWNLQNNQKSVSSNEKQQQQKMNHRKWGFNVIQPKDDNFNFKVDKDGFATRGRDDSNFKNDKSNDDLELYRLTKPFLIFMTIFGSFFLNSKYRKKLKEEISIITKYPILWRVYSFLLAFGACVAMAIAVGILFLHPADITPIANFHIVLFLAGTLFCVIATWIFYMLSSSGELMILLEHYSALDFSEQERKESSDYVVKLTKSTLIFTATESACAAFGWICLMLNSLSETKSTFALSHVLNLIPPPYEQLMFTFFLFSTVVIVNIFCLPQGIFIIFCHIIKFLLHQFNDRLREILLQNSDSENQLKYHIEALYLRYQKIIEMSEMFNNATGTYAFYLIFITTTQLGLIIYVMLFFCADDFSKFLQTFWVIAGTVYLMTFLVSATVLHESASKCISKLNDFNLTSLSSEAALSFVIFVSSAGRPSIGVTPLSVFTITRHFIMSLSASFFTYFFLLLQFSPSKNHCSELLMLRANMNNTDYIY